MPRNYSFPPVRKAWAFITISTRNMAKMAKDTDDYDDEPDFDVGDDLFNEKEKESDKNDDNDYVFDEVKGAHGKKPILSKLNQRKVGKHEMDEIFCDWN